CSHRSLCGTPFPTRRSSDLISWVAREFGYSNLQASHLTGLLGLKGKRSTPGPQSLDKYDQVEQAILEGWPIGEIEKTFGVHRDRSEEHTSELQSRFDLVCRL